MWKINYERARLRHAQNITRDYVSGEETSFPHSYEGHGWNAGNEILGWGSRVENGGAEYRARYFMQILT